MSEVVLVRNLGLQPYKLIWQQLKTFTQQRDTTTIDQIWLLEHEPVFTQGQAGKPEHVLNPGTIPVIQSDRGGQVTYHGPGQLIVYFLTDIQRKSINIRTFVCALENAVIKLLQNYGITAATKTRAPGVYVADAKICSLGLRVRHGRTYHGLSLNVAMDLEPFSRINPCGFSNMPVTQVSAYDKSACLQKISKQLLEIIAQQIGYEDIVYE
jgi:lipoyl(octanoyl) transferase